MSLWPSKIRIISRPQGEPPDWVLDAWIGCELKCEPHTCGHTPEYSAGVLTGHLTKVDGFNVDQIHAYGVLRAKSPQAAKWWYSHGYPYPCMYFRFISTCAEVIETVEDAQGRIIVYDDIETGTLRPIDY